MGTLYSRSGQPFNDLATFDASVRAAVDSQLSAISSRFTNKGYVEAQNIGRALGHAVAGVVANLAFTTANALDSIFPQYATRTILELWGTLLDLPPKPATYATGYLRASGVDGTIIDIGSTFSRADGAQFVSTETVTIASGVATFAARAVNTGAAGNCEAGSEFTMRPTISGVMAVISYSAFGSGSDVEQTEAYRSRIIARFSTPAMAGARGDYERLARAVTAIDNAWCRAHTPIPGYVTLLYSVDAANGGPIPSNTGAAHVVPIAKADVNNIYITHAVTLAKFGHYLTLSEYSGGKILFEPHSSLGDNEYVIQAVSTANVLIDSVPTLCYKFALATALPSVPAVWDACSILCRWSRAVYDGCMYDSTGAPQLPSESRLYVLQPTAQTATVAMSVTPNTTSVRNAVQSELDALLKNAAPGSTVSNWQLHEAVAGASGHTGHTITDVDGDGATAGVSIGSSSIITTVTITFA